ncbi:NAD(P)-dependent dehydrogenase (short-subunit alcohol dehydrogenase family) [Sphingomonas vulcanisoli]|uniref:NAD(P)-dependent dehydrogenase (Short-subunit alcohol dehydrogenase family) n=1 Tax=Sphingomonas vulcanisoli TaxID=1658060 RepID=A0ABX0TY15_9SPHN|nr:NAD(P)-dependent dehydrogenase (short-subunit alcohol dehydrogenase family) [Sphingomonas vulcanisoli]
MVGAVAVVVGAGGGIGSAFVDALGASGRFDRIHALARRPGANEDRILHGPIDITDEASIAAAAGRLGEPVDLVLVATGWLHDAGHMPERALRDLEPAALARSFAVNTIGPALLLKHFAPLLPKDRRAVIAMLSARVGSISDNRTGGWYGYRASKAALNMIIRSAAIELRRTRPEAICVALHPGTVDTSLSAPFQGRVPPERLFGADRAARQLLAVIDDLTLEASGRIFAWDGKEIDP